MPSLLTSPNKVHLCTRLALMFPCGGASLLQDLLAGRSTEGAFVAARPSRSQLVVGLSELGFGVFPQVSELDGKATQVAMAS